MWIDAYDALGVSLDCSGEEIKKAFHAQAKRNHPDKAFSLNLNPAEMGERYKELQEAREVLEDDERRKRYNTFGIDLGKEQPETEVFNLGCSSLVQPMGVFLLKTVVCRLALWLLTYSWIVYLLLFCGLVGVILFGSNINIDGMSIRSFEGGLTFLLPLWIVNALCIVQWIVPEFLVDTLCILYLSSEVAGLLFLENWKVGGVALVVSIFLAWLVQGWWLYIVGLEVVLTIGLLIAVVIASCIIRLWIEQVQQQREQKVKDWRLNMRKERERWANEVEDLKKQLSVSRSEVDNLRKTKK